jgi:WD40 repeat protein
VWTERGSLAVDGDPNRIEVSRSGLVAVARDRHVEVWNVATHTRRAGPADHVRDVRLVAWSPADVLASSDDEIIQLWNPATGLTRAIYAPHTSTMVWSADGRTLFTSDGKLIEAWPVDLATGASPAELRARLDALTSARIVDGRVTTP